MRVERLDDPAPAPDEDVVAPDACGICGTDIHIIDGEFLGTRFPIVYNDELTTIGSMAILHSFERARDIVAAGIIDGDALITHRVALGDDSDAIAAFRRGDGLKIQLTPPR